MRLQRRQFTQRFSQATGQFLPLRLPHGARICALHGIPVGNASLRTRPPKSSPELIYRPGGGQPGQQGRKISHTLTAAKLKSRDESFLETVGSIGVIAQQPVRSPPHGRAVFFDNCLPVNHLQAPLETSFFARSVTGRYYISRCLVLFYYKLSQLSTLDCQLGVACPEQFDILF